MPGHGGLSESAEMNRVKLPTDFPTPIQPYDFCNPCFDNEQPHAGPLKKIYILYSTPRSGSTFLCSTIYHKSGLVIHEYLQPFQYFPYLAERFGAVDSRFENGRYLKIVSLHRYLQALVAARAQQGVLGINCHLSHMRYLHDFINLAKSLYPNLEIEQDYLYRRNLYRQAASYAIARESKLWSQIEAAGQAGTQVRSDNNKTFKLKIQAAVLYKKLKRQHSLMMVDKVSLPTAQPIRFRYCYEDLAADRSAQISSSIISRLQLVMPAAPIEQMNRLVPQSGDINDNVAASIKRFNTFYLGLGIILVISRKIWAPLSKVFRISQHQTKSVLYFLEVTGSS